MSRILRILCTGWVAWTLAGCGKESDLLVGPSPLILRSLVPADGVGIDGSDLLDVSFVFNRPTSWGEVHLLLLPPPVSAGPLRSSATGRTLVSTDLRLAEVAVQRLLLFGGSLDRPTYAVYFTVPFDQRPQGRFLGWVRADAGNLTGPKGVVIFAIDPQADFNPLQPSTFAAVTPFAFTAISHDGDGSQAQFLLDHLAPGTEALVVAVLDTSGDGVHDPAADWWGYHHAIAQVEPTVVTARAVDVDTNVDISLGPPR